MSTVSHIQESSSRYIPIITEWDLEHLRKSLKSQGAVIIRTDASLSDFEALSNDLMIPMVHHSTSTIERDAVNADATTSTVNKGMDAIPLHREGSYAPGCPDILMLYCVRPADQAGETILCDGVALVEILPEATRDFVVDAILNWRWRIPPDRWMATLNVASKTEAVKRLEQIKSRFLDWEKLDATFDDNILEGLYETKCVIPTRWGNEKAFCNSLLIYHFREESEYYPKKLFTPTLGDGSQFPVPMLLEIANLAGTITCDVRWMEHDILLVDNSRYMHGRRAFVDTQRRILIRMGYVRGNSL